MPVGLSAEGLQGPVSVLWPGPVLAGGRGDLCEGGFGGPQQILALAGALLAQPRVEADQEAFAGELGAEDFSHRVGDQCLGTQGRPGRITPGGLQQFAEVDRAQGRDPVQADR